jgi:hypothetical protein
MNRVSLMNAGGQLLATRHGARGQTLVFDASTVPAGPCFVVAGNSEGDKLRKLIIAY